MAFRLILIVVLLAVIAVQLGADLTTLIIIAVGIGLLMLIFQNPVLFIFLGLIALVIYIIVKAIGFVGKAINKDSSQEESLSKSEENKDTNTENKTSSSKITCSIPDEPKPTKKTTPKTEKKEVKKEVKKEERKEKPKNWKEEDPEIIIYNRKGWSKNGVNRETGTIRDKDGYDKHGFDKLGFDRQGYHRNTGKNVNPEGLTKQQCEEKGLYKKIKHETTEITNEEANYGPGYDKYGFDKNGIHKITGTEYDEKGFNKKGIHRSYYEN